MPNITGQQQEDTLHLVVHMTCGGFDFGTEIHLKLVELPIPLQYHLMIHRIVNQDFTVDTLKLW